MCYYHDDEDEDQCPECGELDHDCRCGKCPTCGEDEKDHLGPYPFPCLPEWKQNILASWALEDLWETLSDEQKAVYFRRRDYVQEQFKVMSPQAFRARYERLFNENPTAHCHGRPLEPVIAPDGYHILGDRCSVCHATPGKD